MSPLQILPAETKFYDWFEKGAQNLIEAATLLCAMLDDERDWTGRVAQLTELEHHGDFITHEIFDLLHKTFITPLDPPEIEALASRLDDAVDFVQAAGDALLLYQIAQARPPARELAATILAAANEIGRAMALLREKKRLPDILPHVREINRLENEADRIVRDAISAMVIERGDPFDFIRWKEIYDHLEDATDRCEDIADTLRTVVIKYA
jgi:predicted phosphate transport protein (TIGR00153 family)